MTRDGSAALSAPKDRTFSGSFRSGSPLAERAIARDLEEYDDDQSVLTADDETSEVSTIRPIHSQPHSLAGSYQRPSFFTTVSHATVVPHRPDHEGLTRREREQAIEDERELLCDNNCLDPGPAGKRRRSEGASAAETTALLGGGGGNSGYNTVDAEDIDRKWEEAVIAGLIQTTWRREAKVIGKNAAPLVVTFLLQYSLTVASIFTLGHLGKTELGAVSLASMSASITGYAVYQGLATSLDTLCAQAYGSGKKKLVGLQMQRMVFFLWVITIPIALLWYFADKILIRIVPEEDVARMAGLYLKVVALGAPGYACFESGKRFVQAQGIFSASLYVLLICAPLNAFMNWLFVWVSSFLYAGVTSLTRTVALRLGFRWRAYCRGHHGQSDASFSVHLCVLCCRIRVLEWADKTRSAQLGSDDSLGPSRTANGGGRVSRLRGPDPGLLVSRNNPIGSAVSPGHDILHHLPDSLHPVNFRQHSSRKPDRSQPRPSRSSHSQGSHVGSSHCRPGQHDPHLLTPLLHPAPLHLRGRGRRARRPSPTPLRSLPALRRPSNKLQRNPSRARKTGDWWVRPAVLLLCDCHAD
ncbi:Putative MATE efflux family protein subfamily [Aspergillus calidoustus]|uniref:Putative MATE efflux family protein subfamily n=1 Tax=Aspergillus calidoustus TaxID=454130 RepID=A0A0U5G1T4_ASPCI|nr:Putative MATE efflux family protein subfamily [Aspergillus calidoustus]